MSDFVYIDRFHHIHRAHLDGTRWTVEQFFASRGWDNTRIIVQDEQILPELIASKDPLVAGIALGLHTLSVNYSNPYITTVAGAMEAATLTGAEPFSAQDIARARKNPAQHVQSINKVSYGSYRFAAGSKIKERTQKALELLSQGKLAETMIFNRSTEIAVYIFALRCMDLAFFNQQETAPVKCYENTWLHRTVETLPEGVNIFVQDQSKRPRKDGSNPVHQPKFVRGGTEYPGPLKGRGRLKPGRMISIEQLLESSLNTIAYGNTLLLNEKHGIPKIERPHRELSMPFDILSAN